jgi:hypothetical protein
MKTSIRFMVLFATILLLTACAARSPRVISITRPTNNPDYRVEFLFEHDGCRVYRFLDNGYYVYFTTCTGETTAVYADSTIIQITNSIQANRLQ